MVDMGISEDEIRFPKPVLEKAFAYKLIDDEQLWLGMLQDRNKTSHIYNEQEIDRIYKNIVERYYPEIRKCYEKLKDGIYKRV